MRKGAFYNGTLQTASLQPSESAFGIILNCIVLVIKMNVIDLIDDDRPKVVARITSAADRRGSGELVRITSREGRKAANRIANDYPTYDEVIISSIVQTFCVENPGIKDVATIAQHCLARLDDSSSQLSNDVHPATSAQSSKHNSTGSLGQTNGIDVDDDFEEVGIVSKSSPLVEVLRLFPNAKKNEVNSLLEKFGFEINAVVQHMLDKGYEKEEPEDSQEEKNEEKATVKHDFTSNTWETSAEYRKDAVNELQRNFPFLTQPSLAAYFKKEQYHFYHTVLGIEKRLKINALFLSPAKVQKVAEALSGEPASSTSTSSGPAVSTMQTPVKKENAVIDLFDSQSDTYNLSTMSPVSATKTSGKTKSTSARAMLSAYNSRYLTKEQSAELRTRCDKTSTGLTVKTTVLCVYTSSSSSAEDSRLSYLMQPLDSVLQAEIDFMTEHRLKELLLQDQQAAEALNEQIATEDGSLMECGCCYGEYAFEALVQCSEGHLFCKQCLQRYCEQTVFGNGRSSLKCMCTAEVCEGFFSDSMLRHSLPDKVFEKFSQALSRDALTAAKIEGMVTCYHCSMQMQMEEDAGSVIHCPYCRHQTCRLCNEKSHVPLRCSEVEKKSDTSARLSVEEAMTQARLRECKKCKTKFFKVEGCNKMTCRCSAIICYVCREDISKLGYAHFCQTAHCDHKKCNKCKLFTDTLEDDRIAMKEAGLQTLLEEQKKLAAEKEGKAGSSTDTTTATGVNKPSVVGLDLDKLLEGGGKLKTTTAAPAGHPNVLYARPYVPAVAPAPLPRRQARGRQARQDHAAALQAHAAAVAAAGAAAAGAAAIAQLPPPGRGWLQVAQVPPVPAAAVVVAPPAPVPAGAGAGGAAWANWYYYGRHGLPPPAVPPVPPAAPAARAAVAAAQAAQAAAQAARIAAIEARARLDQQHWQLQIERQQAAQQAAAARRAEAQQRQDLAQAGRQERAEATAARKAALRMAVDERRRQTQQAQQARAEAQEAARAQTLAVAAAAQPAVPAPVTAPVAAPVTAPAPKPEIVSSPATRSSTAITGGYIKKENKRVKTESK